MDNDLWRTCSCGTCFFDWKELKWFRWARKGDAVIVEWLETGSVCKCGTRLLGLGEGDGKEEAAAREAEADAEGVLDVGRSA